mgnify:FL=1
MDNKTRKAVTLGRTTDGRWRCSVSTGDSTHYAIETGSEEACLELARKLESLFSETPGERDGLEEIARRLRSGDAPRLLLGPGYKDCEGFPGEWEVGKAYDPSPRWEDSWRAKRRWANKGMVVQMHEHDGERMWTATVSGLTVRSAARDQRVAVIEMARGIREKTDLLVGELSELTFKHRYKEEQPDSGVGSDGLKTRAHRLACRVLCDLKGLEWYLGQNMKLEGFIRDAMGDVETNDPELEKVFFSGGVLRLVSRLDDPDITVESFNEALHEVLIKDFLTKKGEI